MSYALAQMGITRKKNRCVTKNGVKKSGKRINNSSTHG
ncbi:hypothetical protein [Thermosynechococcus sp. QKsg1]